MQFFQVPPPPTGSIDPFIGWVIALLFGTLTTAIGILWRQAVAESKRKDDLIDRKDAQIERLVERLATVATAQETSNDVTHTAIEVVKRLRAGQ